MLAKAGDRCTEDSTCQSGWCREGSCRQGCSVDADCTAIQGQSRCGSGGYCLNECTLDRNRLGPTSACVGGIETSCGALDSTYCDVCDGLCPAQRCIAEVGCAPLSDVGEPCERSSDCRTNNCSAFAGVCRVPLETACDGTNCDLCLSDSNGWSYCSRECGDDARCPGDRCLGSLDENFFWCRPACGTGCQGFCSSSTEGTEFCDEGLDTWTTTRPQSAELQPCHASSQCSEGTCFGALTCDYYASWCTGYRGLCSGTCASDADCGDSGRCIDIPCAGGATTNCGSLCLPTCMQGRTDACPAFSGATCRELTTVGGGTATVCDPRQSDGSSCDFGTQCVSGTCSSDQHCIAAGGLSNGSACATSGDCASGNCQSSVCHGTALRGDPCTTSYDCSVGTCTSGICN